ncbi:thiamine pyrophosphokinase [Phycomyces blakesleeanus]
MNDWAPSSILLPQGPPKPFCLIQLNQPIVHVHLFERLWANATIRLCADGGTNRLYDAFENSPEKRDKHLPDEIRGDLDSIRPEVRAFYEAKAITRIEDQNSTDFTKCVCLMKEKETKLGIKDLDVVAMSAIGGRFDQTIASINTLYFMKHEKNRHYVLVSDENLTILLDKGIHHLQCSEYDGPTCGVMPIGSPATITTKGLEWNLDNTPCFFGGMVSTSNAIAAECVVIETDSPVVWTSELRPENVK